MMLALSGVNSSLIQVAEDYVLCRWQDDNTAAGDPADLELFLARALEKHLVGGLKALTWIHGAPNDLQDAIGTFAREQDIGVFQTMPDMTRASEVNFIHPYANKEDFQDMSEKCAELYQFGTHYGQSVPKTRIPSLRYVHSFLT
jgi:hypothetical protein